MKILGGFKVCSPKFNLETDPITIVIPTTEPNSETVVPTPEDNKHLEIGVQVGQLQAKVEELQTKVQELTTEMEIQKAEQRWTDQSLSDLFNQMWETKAEVREVLEEIEETQEVEEVETAESQIPAVPQQIQQQEEPEPEKSKRPWFL